VDITLVHVDIYLQLKMYFDGVFRMINCISVIQKKNLNIFEHLKINTFI